MSTDKVTFSCTGKAMYHEGEFVGRSACGADLTAVIEEVPQDGQDHQIECPACGNTANIKRT